jgi:transcriptional regulator with XRE-family HTH domain
MSTIDERYTTDKPHHCTTMTKEILAARLKAARTSAGMTQEQAAKSIGVTRTAITKIEDASREVSTLELAGLAKIYGRTIASFFDEANP